MKYIKTYESKIDWNVVLHDGTWTHKEIGPKNKIGDRRYYLNFEKIKLALENGADVEFCGTLYWSTRNNYFEIVKLCLEHGANVNYQDNDCKWTPLMSASNDGYVSIAKILIDYDADPFIGNFQGYTTMDVITPNSKLQNASFGYEHVSKTIQKSRDEIRKYVEKSIHVVSKKYNL